MCLVPIPFDSYCAVFVVAWILFKRSLTLSKVKNLYTKKKKRSTQNPKGSLALAQNTKGSFLPSRHCYLASFQFAVVEDSRGAKIYRMRQRLSEQPQVRFLFQSQQAPAILVNSIL